MGHKARARLHASVISRLLQNIGLFWQNLGLFCRALLQKRPMILRSPRYKPPMGHKDRARLHTVRSASPKSPTSAQKSPIFPQKSPSTLQKSPISPQKSPVIVRDETTPILDRRQLMNYTAVVVDWLKFRG